MQLRKYLIVAAAVACTAGFTLTSHAEPDLSGPKQDTEQREGRRHFNGDAMRGDPAERLLALREKLELTDEQVEEIRELITAQRAEMDQHRKQMRETMQAAREARESGDEEAAAEAMARAKELRENAGFGELREAIEAVMTEDQKATLDEMKRERARKMGGDRQRPGHGGLEKLELTDEQKEQLQAIRETMGEKMDAYRAEHAEQIEAIRGRMKAAREAKDREAMREAAEEMKKLFEGGPVSRESMREALESVLTEEQRQKLKAMHEGRKEKAGERSGRSESRSRGRGDGKGEQLELD